jgi:hypothetical protein
MVVALVRAHLLTDPAYIQTVRSYVKVSWQVSMFGRGMLVANRVGGHQRRVAFAKKSIDSLACVCECVHLVSDRTGPPVGCKRNR